MQAAPQPASCLWMGSSTQRPCQRAGVVPIIRRDDKGEPWQWKVCRTHARLAAEGGWLACYAA